MNKLASFIKLLKLFWSNSEKLVKLFNLLWSQLPFVGGALEGAGGLAALTAKVINEGSGPVPGAAQVVTTAANAVDTCRQKLEEVAGHVHTVSEAVLSLDIPAITIEDVDWKVYDPLGHEIGHVTLKTPRKSSWQPLSGFNSVLVFQEGCVAEAATGLYNASQGFHGLSSALAEAGTKIDQLGTDLYEAGRLLKEIAADS